MEILITGGAGFIGTALAHRLKKQGMSPVLLDLEGRFKAQHTQSFETVTADIRNQSVFENLLHRRFNVIFHLAAQATARISHEEPDLDIDTNLKGTLHVAQFARRVGCKRFIFSSTMGVYGTSAASLKETDPLRPTSLYGITKTAGEGVVRLNFPENHTIFRFFNVYGPGQDYFDPKHGMASIFMSQMIRSLVVSVTGSLERYRDFVYIDDVLDGLCLALNDQAGRFNDTFNIGTGKKTTCFELIQGIAAALGKTMEQYQINAGQTHEGDVFGTVSDCSKLKGLGWRPVVDLGLGLKHMAADAVKVLQ